MKQEQSMMRHLKCLSLAFCALVLSACGSNIFEAAEKDSEPLDAATRALEKEDPGKAIDILLNELGSEAATLVRNTNDASLSEQLYDLVAGKADYPQYLSVLSAAYAQSGGLDPIDIFLKMSEEGDHKDGQNPQHVTALFPIMPAATSENILAVDKALYIIRAIPTELHTPADTFKIGLLLTGSFTLKLKALDLNGDGTVSPEEALHMSHASASAILSSLAYAITSLDAYGQGQDSNKALETMNKKLGTIQAAIDASEGEDNAEKLAAYLEKTR